MLNKINYIAFEGIDGSGKSTQIELMCNYLIQLNYTPIHLKEPTSGGYGAKVRELFSVSILRDLENEERLFTLDRLEHVRYKVLPVLDMMKSTEPHCGFKILQDRSYYSSPAYQALDESAMLMAINKQKGIAPSYDAVFLLDISVEIALKRLSGRLESINLIESRKTLERARKHYRFIAGREDKIFVINAEGTPKAIHSQIVKKMDLKRFDPPKK